LCYNTIYNHFNAGGVGSVRKRLWILFAVSAIVGGLFNVMLGAEDSVVDSAPNGESIPSGDSILPVSNTDNVAEDTPINIHAQTSPCQPEAKASNAHFIDVSVATLWGFPDTHRAMDIQSLQNPANVSQWTKGLTIKDRLWLVGKIETQALYGSKVEVLEAKGDWVKVAAAGQETPLHPSGYPGWIPKQQLAESSEFGDYSVCPYIVVHEPTTRLYHDMSGNKPFIEISFNTRLPAVNENGDWIQVFTPKDGPKWIKASDVYVFHPNAQIPAPSGEDLVTTARKFLGLPYLWAGISGFGFDCSGFTFTIHQFNGISIPRDSKDQFTSGTPVEKKDLQPGDLVFFAYDQGKGKIHHVAMYYGDGKIIHSPRSERTVEIISMDNPSYAKEYAGARRYN
jgi:cell wall-associated NlpC family hydrolase